MNFQQLKQNSQSQIDAISQALNQTQLKKESYGDDRIWKCERDKSGNGYAVIRFLPPSEGEDLPWVRIFSLGFECGII